MIRKLFISTAFATALTTLAISPAGAVEYARVQPEKSRIAFTSKQMGVAVDGHFRKFSAALNFDPAKPAAASAKIDIDLNSVDAGSKDADDEVVGKQWFNVKVFPTASFVSSSVKPLGGDRYEASGKISIKGKTQEVTLPFTVRQEGGNAIFDGSMTIKRLDFAIGEGPWTDVGTVANEVQIKFHFVAAKK
ncbi:MAG: YceI family protein [Rhodocyclaceae bacterium]